MDSKQEKPESESRQQDAKTYAKIRRGFAVVEFVLIGGFFAWLIFGGLSEKVVSQLDYPFAIQGGAYFALLIAAYYVIMLPVNYYRNFVLPKRYGLLKQDALNWLLDSLKMPALIIPLGGAVTAVLYLLIEASPNLWWLPASAIMILISFVLSVLVPVVIMPLFYEMKPLEDKSLKERIEKLARKARSDITGIYTINLSEKSTGAEAMFMGLGKTKRIAISDTLLESYTEDEIEVIVAHELGHNKNKDFWRLLAFQAPLSLLSFFLVHISFNALVGPLGYSGIGDIAAFPLLAILLVIISSFIMPIANTFVRSSEWAADEYALKLTGNPESFITMMNKITDQNLDEAEQNKLIESLLSDHPSCAHRVLHAEEFMKRQKAEEE